MARPSTFQEIILSLQQFWADQGCVILQPLDMEVGAGTFHPATFLRAIGPKPWAAAYVQPSRRPTDGRYGDNPNRVQHYYQFQVVYGDVFYQNEVQQSAYNFDYADVDALFHQFDAYAEQAKCLVARQLPLPAYEMVIKASHVFNLLDARSAISVTERQRYILRVRELSRLVAQTYAALERGE